MLTGSLASSYQGMPRSTHDIDLVIEISKDRLNHLFDEFDSTRYYISRDAAIQAIESQSMFNLVDLTEGYKVDFWVLTDKPFDQTRFRRRVRLSLQGVMLFVSSPEDTILMKLRWSKDSGGSTKQFNDAKSVYEVQGAQLDSHYIDHWAKELDVSFEWIRLQREAQPLR
jgi:hypothetical protein